MYIQTFLKTYDDNHLNWLLDAAKQDRVVYHDAHLCFLGRHQMGYTGVKASMHSRLAWQAEGQFRESGFSDHHRCQMLIPLIEGEIIRRDLENYSRSKAALMKPVAEPVPEPAVVEEKVEELVCV